MKQSIRIAVIGGGFMGKAHCNAWHRVSEFFDVAYQPVLQVLAGHHSNLDDFARRWGFGETSYNWQSVVARDDIDIVDICTPTDTHRDIVIAAAQAGKHIICEKPFTLTSADARSMLTAVEIAGVVHYLNHNYRRVPAVALARKLISDGRLGRIFHWRGAYFQDWLTDPAFPRTWQLQRERAGGGPLFDLTSHAVDLARYLIGEPLAVTAVNRTFIAERPEPGAGATAFHASGASVDTPDRKLPVDVDDASFALVEFANGILGSVESSRVAQGCKNHHAFEVYGSKGSLKFDLERLNELEFLDATETAGEHGFRRILVTEAGHPYLDAWWPTGHIIGYEHTFVHAFHDFLQAVAGQKPITPDFHDGLQIIRILEAIRQSSDEGRRITIDPV
jgi:predicted dehydrogenase